MSSGDHNSKSVEIPQLSNPTSTQKGTTNKFSLESVAGGGNPGENSINNNSSSSSSGGSEVDQGTEVPRRPSFSMIPRPAPLTAQIPVSSQAAAAAAAPPVNRLVCLVKSPFAASAEAREASDDLLSATLASMEEIPEKSSS